EASLDLLQFRLRFLAALLPFLHRRAAGQGLEVGLLLGLVLLHQSVILRPWRERFVPGFVVGWHGQAGQQQDGSPYHLLHGTSSTVGWGSRLLGDDGRPDRGATA